MTTIASSFSIWSNRHSAAGASTTQGYAAGTPQNDVHRRSSNADARWIIVYNPFENAKYHSRLWTDFSGSKYDWLTQFQRTPSIVLNTANAYNFGADTTPTLEFTGTDLDGDDIRYEVEISLSNTFTNLLDSYSETNQDADEDVSSEPTLYQAAGQTFTATRSGNISSVKFYLGTQNSNPSGNAFADLYAVTGVVGDDAIPTGSPLGTSDPFDVSILPSFGKQLATFNFSTPPAIVLGTGYAIIVRYSGADNFMLITPGSDQSSGTHAGNAVLLFQDNWFPPGEDFCFYIYDSSASLNKISGTDTGFLNTISGGDTDPFNSAQRIGFTIQSADALAPGTYYFRVRAKDPLGSNSYSDWSATQSFIVTSGGAVTYLGFF